MHSLTLEKENCDENKPLHCLLFVLFRAVEVCIIFIVFITKLFSSSSRLH